MSVTMTPATRLIRCQLTGTAPILLQVTLFMDCVQPGTPRPSRTLAASQRLTRDMRKEWRSPLIRF